MAVKDDFNVMPIQNSQCNEWILKKHYAKRMPPIQYALGLFKKEPNRLEGIVTFSTPVSPQVRNLFSDKYKTMELNRLVVNEGLGKNVLSYFVSSALSQLPKPLVIISFADTEYNHHGYIYQATNFIYTGLSAKRKNWKVRGLEHLHSASIADLSRGKEGGRAKFMREKYGDDFYLEDRSRKHRYFYFLGSKSDVKNMKAMLPHKIEPYPKGENVRYDSSYIVSPQLSIFNF